MQEYVIAFHKKDKLLPRFILLVNFCDKCLAFGMCSMAVISLAYNRYIGQTQMFLPASAGKAGKRVTRGLVVVVVLVTHLLLKHVKSI